MVGFTERERYRVLNRRKMISSQMTKCIALILSGGSGSRFGSNIPKQYHHLNGKSVLRHAIDAFIDHESVDSVRVVVRPGDEELYQSAVQNVQILPSVEGGETRQISTLNGLRSFSNTPPDIVLIHDGARPFPSKTLISEIVKNLKTKIAVVPTIPLYDTLKLISNNGLIIDTVDRSRVVRAQTPQGFRYQEIFNAHLKFLGHNYSDDATIAEKAGIEVTQVAGHEDNIKITHSKDINRAKEIIGVDKMIVRTGIGFDVHAFGQGTHIILGGIKIKFHRGLLGHSDADTLLHALTDAILGAICREDIGFHFPPTDPKWADADSAIFLKHAANMLDQLGGFITSLDSTIICENPKIAPHRDAICKNIAKILNLPKDRISVKATTTEQLGFTGREDGLAAQAIATVMLPSSL